MSRRLIIVTIAVVMALSAPAFAAGTPKPGTTCPKRGATAISLNVKYTCVSAGSRLVWNKGVAIKPSKAQLAAETARRNAQIARGDFVTVPSRLSAPLEVWKGFDFDGKPFSTGDLNGKVSVVNIWASWCGPCKEEWPVLQQAAAEHPSVRFVGVNTQDRLDKAKEWLATNPSNYQHVFDERGGIKAALTTVPNYALPITVVLDSKGRVAAWITGAIKVEPLRKILKQIK